VKPLTAIGDRSAIKSPIAPGGMPVEKVDLKKEMKHLYQPPANRVVQVDVPEMNYLMIDGEGDLNGSQGFQDGVEVLFALSYTAKFMVKKGPQAVDYGVMPLEGLWWADDMAVFSIEDKSNWKWTLMIMQPPYVSGELVETAIAEVKRKKNPAALSLARFEALLEGKGAQTLHIGPFSDEGPTIQRVHQFIEECGCKPSGKHHEIYLSDIRKADPRNWKTVIRQPMA
jgi:hypothetical protein